MRTLLAVIVLAVFATSTHADTRGLAHRCVPTGTGPISGTIGPIGCGDIPSPIDMPAPIELSYPAR